MMDDDLRRRLEEIDPVLAPASAPPPDMNSSRLGVLVEEIMTSPVDAPLLLSDDAHPLDGHRRRHRLPMLAGGVAAVALAGFGVAAVLRDEPASRQSLSVAAAGTTMSSCLPFDVNILREMPVAFAGTAQEIMPTKITIVVDRWYRVTGDETDLVDLTLPGANTSAALDGVEFVEGQRYLFTATDGTVNGCGFSGLASAELEAAFESAFAR